MNSIKKFSVTVTLESVEPVFDEYPSSNVNFTWRFYPKHADITQIRCYEKRKLLYQYPEHPYYLKDNLSAVLRPGLFTLTVTGVADSDAGRFYCRFLSANSTHPLNSEVMLQRKGGLY